MFLGYIKGVITPDLIHYVFRFNFTIIVSLVGILVLGLIIAKLLRLTLQTPIVVLIGITSTIIMQFIFLKLNSGFSLVALNRIVILAIVVIVLTSNNMRTSLKILIKKMIHEKIGIFYLSAFIPIMIPTILTYKGGENKFPIFTWGNNDVSVYVLEAQSILKADGSFLSNMNFLNFALENDFGAPALLAWISSISGTQTWQTWIMLIVVLNILIQLIIFKILEQVQPKLVVANLLVTVFIAISSSQIYLIYHVFLSQLIAIIFWGCGIYFLLETRFSYKKVALTFVALFFTYVHMSIFFVSLAFLIFLRNIFHKNEVKFAKNDAMFMLILSLPLSLHFMSGVRRLLIFSEVDAGWSLNYYPSFYNLFSNRVLSENLSISLLTISFILMIIIVLVETFLRDQSINPNIRIVLIYSITIALIVGIRYSFISYNFWKIYFSFLPFFLVCIYLILSQFNRILKLLKNVMIKVLMIIVLVIYTIQLQKDIVSKTSLGSPQLTSSKDMYALNYQLREFKLEELNIDLSPYFENMIVPAIISDVKSSVNGLSYFGDIQNLSTCTLKRSDQLSDFDKQFVYRNVNNTYTIISLPNTCKFLDAIYE